MRIAETASLKLASSFVPVIDIAPFLHGSEAESRHIAREVDKAQSEVLKQMWEKIGVRASIDAVERAALNQRILSGGADYQVTSGQYGNYASDADVHRPGRVSRGGLRLPRHEQEDPRRRRPDQREGDGERGHHLVGAHTGRQVPARENGHFPLPEPWLRRVKHA